MRYYSFNIVLLALIFFSSRAYSQQNLFTVVAANNKVQIKIAKSSEIIKPAPGLKLNDDDEIQISENGYIGLAHSSLSTIELDKAGNYKVISILNNLDLKQHSLTKKFMNFVIDEMAEKRQKSKEMRTLGAVVRLSKNRLNVNLPQNICLYDSVFTFKWFRSNETDKYIFQLVNPANKTIFMKDIVDTSLSLNFSDLNLQENKSYKWLIFDSKNTKVTSDSVKFYVLSKSERKKITEELNDFSEKFSESNSALDHLVFATYLRDKGLYLRAIDEYQKVVEIASGVNEYWTHYLQFLMDVGLKKQALEEWSKSIFIGNF